MRALSISMSAGVVGMRIAFAGAFTSERCGDNTCSFPGLCTVGLFSPYNKRILSLTNLEFHDHRLVLFLKYIHHEQDIQDTAPLASSLVLHQLDY